MDHFLVNHYKVTLSRRNTINSKNMSSSSPSDHLSSDGSEHDNEEVPQKQEVMAARTETDKKMDRVLANRRSARRSRERRKKLQQNLEISVAFLSRQNDDLTRENNTLKQELRVLIDLVNQLSKQRPMASSALSDAVTMLSQIQTTSAASAVPPPTSNGILNQSLSLLSGGASNSADLLNTLTPEQVLAMSQLITNQNQQQQNMINTL